MGYTDVKMCDQNPAASEGEHPPDVSIVVVNYRGVDDTIECLESLLRSCRRDFDIVVVDNASRDGSEERLASWIGSRGLPSTFDKPTRSRCDEGSISSPSVRISLIRTEANLGFSGGNNAGIRHALQRQANWILLLNNDTVVAPNTLDALLRGAESAGADLAGCSIWEHSRPDRLWCGEGRFGWWADKYVSTVSAIYSTGTATFETDWVTGCCLLVSRQVFEKIGVLDDHFFLYCEDVDFSRRAARAGFKRVIVTGAKIYHKGGRSAGIGSPLACYHSTRSRVYYHLKHDSLVGGLAFLALFILSRAFRTMEWLIRGRLDLAAAIWRGLRDELLIKSKNTRLRCCSGR